MEEKQFRGDIANKIEFYAGGAPDTFRGPHLFRECFIISSVSEWLFRGEHAGKGI